MRRIGEVASASHTHLPIKSNWLALCAAQVVHEDGAQHNAANRKLSTRAGACAHALARTLRRMYVYPEWVPAAIRGIHFESPSHHHAGRSAASV